ncbi:adenosine deaminase [Acidicapsa dinghuensis]|uniref:Adenosine deaminase n=1 Tax=Acidicapsa dinghuensis TaxID=2218256 RepID=A0ABW1EDA1_9BACT|nr:adenosine deaminase [Acidicapsa dinghuensis]
MATPDMDTLGEKPLDDFIRGLPKAELHLHLEGTIEPATLVELSECVDAASGARPITLAEAEALYEYKDFSGFLLAFKAVTARLRGPAEYELAAWRMIEKLAAQGVRHAEVYISVGVIYYWRKEEDAADPLLFQKIFAGLERARERGERELGLTLYWIFDAVRHFSVEEARRVFRMAAEMRGQYPSIIGIGLGGDERVAASEPFRELYSEATRAGLRLTNHAGETTGPEAIWEALSIGSERLGHALSAIRDGALMEELKRRRIPLELNPSSNCRTGVCTALTDHPVRAYFDAGLMVTLNSDDPAFFGSTIENEYRLMAHEHGFNREELKQLAEQSFEASFLPEEQKQTWVAKVRAFD